MIGRISRVMTRVVSRYLPDPLIFAMLLTMLTFIIALALTPSTPMDLVNLWGTDSGTCWRSGCRWR